MQYVVVWKKYNIPTLWLRVTIVVESILLMALYYTRYKRELWYTIRSKFWYNKQIICWICFWLWKLTNSNPDPQLHYWKFLGYFILISRIFPLMVCTKLCELKCKVIHCVYYPGRNKRATMTKDHFLLLSCDATSVFIRQECFSSHIHNSTTYFVLYRHYITTTTIPFSQKQAIPIVVASLVKNTLDGYGLFW